MFRLFHAACSQFDVKCCQIVFERCDPANGSLIFGWQVIENGAVMITSQDRYLILALK